MKKFIYILIVMVLLSCNSEDANDCFQTTGEITQTEFNVEVFDKILVNRDVELILKEGPDFNVTVETGKNLLNDIEVAVIDNQLILTDNNSCNYVREYKSTKAFVTAPNIIEIRSSTQYDVSSEGTLNYNSLRLLSEDFNFQSGFTMGDFRLDVNMLNLNIGTNGISSFYISGQTENITISFFAGAGRFEGENLMAQHVNISHRGSNDMIVNPQQSLKGVLRGTGHVISKNRPPTVEVEQLYTGQLIYD